MNLSKIAYGLIVLIGSVLVLKSVKDILIPFILAVIIWYVLKEFRLWVKKITFQGKALPGWLYNAIATGLVFVALAVVVQMLSSNISGMAKKLPKYKANIRVITEKIGKEFGIKNVSHWVKQRTKSFNFTKLMRGVLDSLSVLLGNGFMVLLYVLFLLLEERLFGLKLRALYPEEESYEKASSILHQIDVSLGRYLSLKTILSLLTGFLSFVVLKIIGVDFPVFWAVLIFLLNYIPTIGSLLATAFPTLVALLQFGTYGAPLAVLLCVGAVQVVVGNILEPRMMGNSLNVSSLVVLLALAVWGWIWGITGMILCVPITVMMVIICAQFPETRALAVLLSERGNVQPNQTT